MSYRDDVEALRIRRDTVQSELEQLRGQQRELSRVTARIDSLEAELADLRAELQRLETRRSLPVLDGLKIASPCSESWADMVGSDRVRYCGKCEKNVYNVVAMARTEAEKLIADNEDGVCLRLYRRRDGTVLTSDCRVGQQRRRVTRIAAAALAFGGAGLALASMQSGAHCNTIGGIPVPSIDMLDDHEVVMGDVAEAPPMMGSVAPVVESPPDTSAKP